MAEFVQHEPCPNCGSDDNLARYDDGSAYCFGCEYVESNKGESIKQFTNESLVQTYPITSTIRGISPNIFSKFSYFKDDKGVHVINHYDIDGNVVAQKFRHPDKTFSWKGNAKKAVPFGLNLWRSGGKRITITEGELDALSVAEALGGKYPVISINNGAQGAYKELKPYIEILNSYDEIVLWFDNDKPGKEATQKVASLFPPGKVYIVQCTQYKDANEVLMKANKKGVLQFYYETKKHTPNGIVNANEGGVEALLQDETSDEVYTTPYTNLEVSKGAITTIVSGSGMGKSTIVREIGYDLLINKGLKIGHVALEENNSVSKRAYLGIDINKHIIKKKLWKEFKEDKDNLKLITDSYKKVIEPGNLFLYNHFGSLDSDELINKLRYLVIGAECDFIILDHISIVVSGLEDMGDNERRTIDVLMTKLRSLVEETGVGMVLVSHLKRPPGEKGHEDGVQVRLSHLRGSGSIGQLSDSVIGLEGNQQDEENKNIRTIRCLKDREGGETGILGYAKYITDTGRLLPEEVEEDFIDETDEY